VKTSDPLVTVSVVVDRSLG